MDRYKTEDGTMEGRAKIRENSRDMKKEKIIIDRHGNRV